MSMSMTRTRRDALSWACSGARTSARSKPDLMHWTGRLFTRLLFTSLLITLVAVGGCTPTVRVETPDKPIGINLNVKIEHQISVRVDKDLDDLFEAEADIF